MKKRLVHFSIDDVFEILWDLVQGNKKSIFEQEYLAYFKQLHDRCGCTFSGYCFLEKEGRRLSDLHLPAALTEELHRNAGWLKFGFHALDHETAYGRTHFQADRTRGNYEEAYEDCSRMEKLLTGFCGGKESLDIVPRIHYFAGTTEALRAFKDLGILGLLSADDDRLPYDLDEEQMLQLKETYCMPDPSCGLFLIRTAFRLEKVSDVRSAWDAVPEKAADFMEIFTHEYFLDEAPIREKMEACAALACEKGYTFGFLQDVLADF